MTTANQPLSLLIYGRVSSDKQRRHGHSLDDQPEVLAEYAARQGYKIAGIIIEQESAASKSLEEREGGAELLAKLDAGHADGVLVVRIDRLFRNMLDGLKFFADELYPKRRRIGAGSAPLVVSMTERFDTSTAAGRTHLKFALLMDDDAADRTAERTRQASEGLRKRGRVYANIPFGCVAQGGSYSQELGRVTGQKLYRCPRQWPVRQHIVDLRTAGQGMTLRALAAHLKAEGVLAPAGGVDWSTSTLNEMVRSHDSLAHLPLVESEDGAAAVGSHEAGASVGEGAHVH